jgi:T-complex protein 1 subunit epsilon
MRAFSDALDAIPMALAENSGLSPIETLADLKARQGKGEGVGRLGVDCMQTGSNGEFSPADIQYCNPQSLQHLLTPTTDMKSAFVIDPLISKRQQLLLATQLCRMVLKINNVIVTGSDEGQF